MNNKKPTTSGGNSKYAIKKEQMKNGTYHGPSPFFNNIPEFQHMAPLASYPHLRNMRAVERNSYPQN